MDERQELTEQAQNGELTADSIAAMNAGVIAQFRSNGGKVGPPFEDSEMLLLHHRGARTGIERVSPLAYLRHEGALLIVASMGGAPVNPAWYHNLKAHPEVSAEVGTETIPVLAAEVPDEDYAHLWTLITAAYPGYAEYAKATTRRQPILRLTPTGKS